MKKKEKHSAAPSNRKPQSESAPASRGALKFWAGVVFLLVSIVASFMMTLDHFAVMALPGCGLGSGCAKAAASVWGKVPVLGLPTSSVGLAYFVAIAIGWIASRGTPAAAFKWIARFGVLITLGFLIVIAIERHICSYCLAAHAGNLAFWLVMEMSGAAAPSISRRSLPALATIGVAFTLGVTILAAVESQNRQVIAKKAEGERTETTQRVIEQSVNSSSTAQSSAAVHSPSGGFTGRWRLGPESAPIRVVIFSDYQCSDCREIESQMRTILQQRSDVSLSAKHFPMGADCNVHMGGQNIHANACWAARAAEAAGILRGNDGFWQMHHWLFDQRGSFTDESFPQSLAGMGYHPEQFLNIMQSQESLDRVRADVDEGFSLGLHFTPMIFINGVELRGFINNPTALSRTIDELVAKNLPPGNALQDHPLLGSAKCVADWAAQPARVMPSKARDWTLGSNDAPIKIMVWGDYQLKPTADLNKAIRAAMDGRDDVQYIFRQYPADETCNPNLRQSASPLGCWAARAAEAAGALGGNDAYWKMHEWLLTNQSQLNEGALFAAAPALGLDPPTLLNTMRAPAAADAVSADVAVAKPFIVQGIPTIYINGRWVPRWLYGKESVVHLIIEEAAKQR